MRKTTKETTTHDQAGRHNALMGSKNMFWQREEKRTGRDGLLG